MIHEELENLHHSHVRVDMDYKAGQVFRNEMLEYLELKRIPNTINNSNGNVSINKESDSGTCSVSE